MLSEIRWSKAIYGLKCEAWNFKMNSMFNREPVKFLEQWCYMAELVRAMNHLSCTIRDVLELVCLIFPKAKKEGVAVVDLGRY